MTMPRVTVIVCTRDRPVMLRRCLESLQLIEHDSYEILVVDNASSAFVIPELHWTVHTRFFSQPVPGLSRARNCGIEFAQGDILALLDDDAVADPGWLSAGERHFADPEIGCVTGRIMPLRVETEWQRKMIDTNWFPMNREARRFTAESFNAYTTMVGTGSNLLVRKSIARELRFPEFLGPGTPVGAEDEHYLFYRIIREGFAIQYDPDAAVSHDFSSTEEEYRRQLIRHRLARGAYLALMLLMEPGQRLAAWKHLRGKMTDVGGDSPALSRKGLLRGPFALFRSRWQVASLHREAVQKFRLLAEFTGHSAGA